MTTNSAQLAPTKRYKSVTVGDITQAVIAASGTSSSIVDSGGMRLQGLILPSAFTSANITFTVGFQPEDVNYPLYISPDGAAAIDELTLTTCTATQFIALTPSWFNSIQYFKINTSAAQTDGCIITCIFTPIYQGIHA